MQTLLRSRGYGLSRLSPQVRRVRVTVSGLWQTYASMSRFRVIEHTVKCQHTRDRPAGAEVGRDNDLRLHVKQYVPTDNPSAKPGDVTLIGAHANGFPKEMYEPLWDDLVDQLQKRNRNLRGIWIADLASQNQSGIINETLLGPDGSWYDHARDLLFLINQFQDDIPHPIIGVGHSVGGAQLTHLSSMHPRLLVALVLLDPTIGQSPGLNRQFAALSADRRDVWSSRDEAARKFSSSKFYQSWDSRVLEKWIQHGLRDLPTEQYPDASIYQKTSKDVPVTLSTTIAQEVYFYVRPTYRDDRMLLPQDKPVLHDVELDNIPENADEFPFIRPEPYQIERFLPHLRQDVLWIFGDKSPASTSSGRQRKMDLTGTGVGGSGGAALGRVQEVVLDGGHLAPFERTTECALASAKFIDQALSRLEENERSKRERWAKLSRRERVGINDVWRQNLQGTVERENARAKEQKGKL